jgi:hypothetical protein
MNHPADERYPGFSPDGTKMVFISNRDGDWEIFMRDVASGTVTQLTSNAALDTGPAWSPDGAKLAFSSDRDGQEEIYVMKPDGTGVQRLTSNPAYESGPAWSPDGTKMLFASERDGNREIYVMRADGGQQTRLTNAASLEQSADWQPLGALDPYPRPGGGTPLRVPLVPAFSACGAPNGSHVPPLDAGSCAPPAQESTLLTTSSTGAGSGLIRLVVIPGDTGTQADEADVGITSSASDVRCRGGGSPGCGAAGADYTGTVLLRIPVRLTDAASGFGGVSATVEDARVDAPVSCVQTASAAVGGSCSLNTTIDSLLPGFSKEGKRTVIAGGRRQAQWEHLGYADRGADGVLAGPGCPPSCGTGDERSFLEPGVFLP